MYEKNYVGTYQLKDTYPAFGYSTFKSQQTPAPTQPEAVTRLESVSGAVSQLAPLEQWRYFSEQLRQRRMARQPALAEPAPTRPAAHFQQAYEQDLLQLEHTLNPIMAGLQHYLSIVNHPIPDQQIQVYAQPEVELTAGELLVGQVMSQKVACVMPSTTIEQAASLCNRRGFTGLPVVDEHHTLLGIVTLSDILRQILNHEALTTFALADGDVLRQEALAILDEPVRQYMHTDVITVMPETPVSEACRLMSHHGIRRVVVTRGRLVQGIFSAQDAVAVLAGSNLSAQSD